MTPSKEVSKNRKEGRKEEEGRKVGRMGNYHQSTYQNKRDKYSAVGVESLLRYGILDFLVFEV